MRQRLNSRKLAATQNRERLVRGIGWFSIGLGLAQLLVPRSVCRSIGIKPRSGLMRALGLREILTGVGLLSQPEKESWLKFRVAGDAMDLGLIGAAFLDERTNPIPLGIAAGAVAGVTALDVFCVNEMLNRAGACPPQQAKRTGALRVAKSIIVNRSQEELYRVWRDFQRLPRFMPHVLSVEPHGEQQWHWIVKGPAGLQVEWDAQLVDDRPNERIAWQSLPNSDVDNAGSVRFERAPGGRGTIVRVELLYRPPAGKAGATVAKLLGQSPEKQIRVDLLRFRQMVETGEIARTEGQPAGRARSTSRRFDDLVRA